MTKHTIYGHIPNYTGYLVSIDGTVISTLSNSGQVDTTKWSQIARSPSKGYYNARIMKDNYGLIHTGIHRLMGLTFLPNEQATVNHKDGVKTNNTLENLEWNSHSENERHAWQTGLKRKKLCMQDARDIRASKLSHDKVAEQFKVSNRTIRDIRANRAWVEL